MKFEEAFKELRNGKIIRRLAWGNHTLSNNLNNIFHTNDALQDDWIVYEEPGKSFPEVFEAFKEGKKIRRKVWPNHFYIGLTNSVNNIDGVYELAKKDWEIINDSM